jgi:predicted MFS family arabinose efflux permease
MKVRSSTPIDSKRALVALCTSNALGMLVLYVIPIFVGATADGFHAREGTAGIISSWELAVMAVASMILAARFETVDKKLWSIAGAIWFTGGYLLSFWSLGAEQWTVFLLARGISGAGEGILFGVSSGLAAQTARPDRTFAFFSGSHIVASILCFEILPTTIEHLGPVGAFALMAGIGLLAIPVMFWIPASATAPVQSTGGAPDKISSTAVLLILSVGALNLGLNTLFPFTERIGTSIGLTLPEIGRMLTYGAILSILGPIAANFAAPRGGRTLSLGLGSASQVVGTLIVVYATSHAFWTVSYIVTSPALMYFMPLLYGLVAYYDRTGKVNAAAASMTAWMSAAGPLLGGFVLNTGGNYRFIGWITAFAYVMIFVFAYRPSRAAERGLRNR